MPNSVVCFWSSPYSCPRRRRLLRQIHRLRRRALHPERQFVGADARRHLGVAVERVHLVHLLQEVERVALPLRRHPLRRLQIEDRTRARTKHRPLVDRRQESRAPARRAAFRRALRLRHHHIRRQVVALAAQPVGDPRPHARIAHQDAARVHLVHRRRVHRAVGVEAAHEAQVVHALRDVREQRRHLAPALPVLLELPRTAQQRRVALGELAHDRAVAGRQRLAVDTSRAPAWDRTCPPGSARPP